MCTNLSRTAAVHGGKGTAARHRHRGWWTTTGLLAAGLAAVLSSPALAVADLVITVADASQTTDRVAVSLVAPDGSIRTARDDDGDGTVVITPESGPGEYQVTIALGERRDTRRVTVPRRGVINLAYTPDGGGYQATVTYAGVEFGNEQIVVTARKREESLQSIPLSITAFRETAIEARSMHDISNIGDFTPNLDFSLTGTEGAPSEATVYIRGVGQIDSAIFADPGVGIYVDGVYLARAQGAVVDLLDLERIEVLRGPQGTLFGKNTIGGAINLISKKPHEEFSGSVDLTAGDYDRRDLRIRLNTPLTSRLLSSLAISSSNRDGFTESLATDEVFSDENRDAARGALRWIAADNVIVDFTANYMREREKAWDQSLIFLANTPILEFYNTVLGDAGMLTLTDEYITGDLRKSYSTMPSKNDGDVWGTTLTVDWALDSINLRSITGYREIEFIYRSDGDGTPVAMYERPSTIKQDQLSQEFQLSGDMFQGRLNWLVGSLYFTESSSDAAALVVLGGLFEALEAAPGPIYAPPGYPHTLCNPGPAPPGFPCFGGAGNPLNQSLRTDGRFGTTEIDTTSYALFGEGTLAMTERLSATLGLRYTYEEKEHALIRKLNSDAPFERITDADSWEAFSPKFSLAFQATGDTLLYASIAHGFKSGGFNGRVQRGVLDPFDPEKVWAYETGFKTSWARNRSRLNGAFFYYDYSDIQLSASLNVDGEPLYAVQNAGRGKAWGAELEMVVQPWRGWLLTGGFGYIDTEYTELSDVDPNGATLEGRFPKTPEWNFSFSPQYSFLVKNAGTITVLGDYSYRSKVFNDIANTPEVAQEGYSLVNARLVFEPASEAWEIALFGTNLTDEEYLEHAFFAAAYGAGLGIAGRPREWGLSTRFRF